MKVKSLPYCYLSRKLALPVEEIKGNGYDLNINRYREVVYEELSYASPEVLISELRVLENKKSEGLNMLERLLKK